MKYLLGFFFFTFFLISNSLNAQFAIGGGVASTSNTNAVGVQIKSQFSIGQRWRIEGSVTGYSTNNNRDFYGDANLNANFIFTDVGAIELHALLGYNVFFGRLSSAGIVPPTSSQLAQGINIGTGMQYELNSKLNGFLDGIFTFTDFGRVDLKNRFLFTLGVIYEFNNQSD